MELAISDPRHAAKEQHHALDRFWLKLIRDERDLPFIHLSLWMTLVLLPFAVFLFIPGNFTWWLAGIYWAVTYLVFADRYILMLHNTSHRKLFKKDYELLNLYIPWVLGPLCGETPETYYAHHVGMHHAEGNLPADLSSTMRFKRDRIDHFLRYFGRFFFFILFELSVYHARNKRWTLLRRMLVGELTYYAAVAVGLYFNWQATLAVLVIPVVVTRFLMMCGNWSQHAFIHPDAPDDDYLSSITCINSRYNRRCFNDGYHIGHHEMAARHWTDMPADFEKKKDKYRDKGAIIFEGIDYFIIWVWLMLRRYDWLANRFVDLNEEKRSREEVVALLKSRVLPVPANA